VKKEVLPELRGFNGQKLSCSYPWLMRIDIGMHDGGLTDKAISAKWEKGKTVRFLNEVESGPTMYLDARFKHPVDWISFYAQKCVETAYEVTGITPPSDMDEMKRKVAEAMSEGAEKAKTIKPKVMKKKDASKKTKTEKKAAPKKATTKTAVKSKKIAKGVATKTTTTKTTKKAKA
jgi:hypothetical protein